MMKKKNKGKKTLAAVGAVVAAGLTPGIIAATPNAMPVQDPNIGLTAAEVVAIAGNTYSFDELYALCNNRLTHGCRKRPLKSP